MSDPQNCPKCNSTGEPKATRCSSCGAWLRGARRIRRLGGMTIVLGLFLVVLMGVITIAVAPKILAFGPQVESTGIAFAVHKATMILVLFGMIIIFGLAAAINGAWQIFTGRRNILLFVLVILLAIGIIGTALVTVQSLDNKGERTLQPQIGRKLLKKLPAHQPSQI